MSFVKAIISINSFPSNIHVRPSSSSRSQNHLYSSFSNYSANFKHSDHSLVRMQRNGQRRSFVCNAVQPDVPPPSESAFNAINWILGIALTVVLPFFSKKWTSLLRIKSDVDTAVQTAEDIAITVEKAAEAVDKIAEDILHDLPQNGNLRKAVEFVEDVAERTSKDAQIVVDFIDKVQETEEKVVECVESHFTDHEPAKEENAELMN